jgi:hypothetical protein
MSEYKGYIRGFKSREYPESHIIDYDFCELPEHAHHWSIREHADMDCQRFNMGIEIRTPGGTKYMIDTFVVEGHEGGYVIACTVPFDPRIKPDAE